MSNVGYFILGIALGAFCMLMINRNVGLELDKRVRAAETGEVEAREAESRLLIALEKILDRDNVWGTKSENNERWQAMALTVAREAVPETSGMSSK